MVLLLVLSSSKYVAEGSGTFSDNLRRFVRVIIGSE